MNNSLKSRILLNSILQLGLSKSANTYIFMDSFNNIQTLKISFLTNKIKPIRKFAKLLLSLYHIGQDINDPKYFLKLDYLTAKFVSASYLTQNKLDRMLQRISMNDLKVSKFTYLLLPEFKRRTYDNSFNEASTLSQLHRISYNKTFKVFKVFGSLNGLSEILKEKGFANIYSLVDWPQGLEVNSSIKAYDFLMLSLLNIKLKK